MLHSSLLSPIPAAPFEVMHMFISSWCFAYEHIRNEQLNRGQVRPYCNPLDSLGTLGSFCNFGEPQNAENGLEHMQ